MAVNLAVFDLDKTLLRCDSLLYLMRRHPRLGLVVPVIARLLRFLSAAEFTCAVRNVYAAEFKNPAWIKTFCDELISQLDPAIMALATEQQDAGSERVLVSASPQEYVQPLADKIGMKGYGSYTLPDGTYFHAKAGNKIRLLNTLYPKDRYNWYMSVSDSDTDMTLLKAFETGYLYAHNKLKRVTPARDGKNAAV